MCTVTYLPLARGSYLLTSSRDEMLARSPKDITRLISKQPICFPQDLHAGGTWVALEQSGKSICVLNGGKDRHQSQPPYAMSRGIMALHYFRFADALEFFSEFDFKGIEPFTLVITEPDRLIHAWYDGTEIRWNQLDEKRPYIWASVTLYSDDVIARRGKWFEDWLANYPDYSQEDIIQFHRWGGVPDVNNGLIINRDNLIKTVSITSILHGETQSNMKYWELNKNLRDQVVFEPSSIPRLLKTTNQ